MDDRRPDDEPASTRLRDLLADDDARRAAPERPSRPPAFRDADAFRPSPEKRPAFRGDAAFRDDMFEDPRDRAVYGTSLADEIKESERPLADRGTRLAARFLDGIIFSGVMIFIYSLASLDLSSSFPGGAELIILIVFLPLVVYQIRLLATKGQTIGKRALKIRIVDVADGSNPGFGRACLLRDGVFGILWMVPIFGPPAVLGDALSIFRHDRRCLHDHLAKTVVVRDAA